MLQRPVLVITTLALAGFLGTGCMRTLEEEYRDAVPTAAELSVEVPGAAESSSGPGAATGALIGERAPFYQITRDASRAVNGGLWVVMQVVAAIVRHPATEVDDTRAVWGPWNETLSPITYVFMVERVGEGQYHYALQGKPRAAGDDAYVTLLAGETDLDAEAGLRRGTVGLDFDAAHALDAYEHRESGRIVARWDVGTDPRFVEAAFEDFTTRRGDGPVSALYRYREASDGSGSFEFAFVADIDDPGAAVEEVVLMTRWDATGAGRGDAVISGGDAGDAVIYANECWDESFGRTYWVDNAGMISTEGDASACPFDEPLWSEISAD